MKTKKQINQLERLKKLRAMHDGDVVKCKSLDEQIKRMESNSVRSKRINVEIIDCYAESIPFDKDRMELLCAKSNEIINKQNKNGKK